jgi:hypothetical protein
LLALLRRNGDRATSPRAPVTADATSMAVLEREGLVGMNSITALGEQFLDWAEVDALSVR